MNKFKSIIIISIFISILSISKVYAQILDYTLLGKTIYIDPGHGGIDSGTTYKNIYEKDINLIMAKKIEKYLVSKGVSLSIPCLRLGSMVSSGMSASDGAGA